ncbi:MAG: YtxH domain-containing protein [Bacteroidota bacterium]
MSNSGNVLLGVLVGAAAGVITGILIAPASGKETREKISGKTDDLLTQIKDLLSKTVDEEVVKKQDEKKKTSSAT